MLRHVSETGHQAGFTVRGFIKSSDHLYRKTNQAVFGCLEPHIPAPLLQPFTGQYTAKIIALFFIVAKQIPAFFLTSFCLDRPTFAAYFIIAKGSRRNAECWMSLSCNIIKCIPVSNMEFYLQRAI